MKNLVFKITLYSLLIVVSVGCSGNNSSIIEDTIPILAVTSGAQKTVLISDLFYASDYQLKLKENQNLTANFNKSTNELEITTNEDFEGLTLLDFELNGGDFSIGVVSKKETYYEFSYTPTKEYKELNLFGTFNGWNRHQIPMTDEDGDGVFKASIPLEPGVYQYKFYGDGEEIVDPNNPVKISNGMGSFNSIREIADNKADKVFLHVDGFDDEAKKQYSFIADYKNKSALTADEVVALLDNTKIPADKIDIKGSRIIITLEQDYLDDENLLRVALSKNGKASNVQHVLLNNGIPAGNDSFTWYDATIYSIMIDRFNDGDESINVKIEHDSLADKANYMGGDLKGIIDKIEEGYFTDLGINTIWISPVYDNPNEAFREFPAPHRYFSGYHGYWPIHHQRVEEKFGTMETLKQLVATAHKNDIKILLDFVSNHTHEQHPFFKENRDWYGVLDLPNGEKNLRRWDEYRLTTWFEPYLPSFDYLSDTGVMDAVIENAIWWLEQTGADGYRHDAVKHVPNEFWRLLTQRIKAHFEGKRDLPVYQIGETFGSYDLISSYVNNGQLHAQFNFNLYDVAIPTFSKEGASFAGLSKEMNKTFSVYGNLHLMGNVMDSHDKNRFMAYADGDLDASHWSAAEIGWNNPPKVDNDDNYKKLILFYTYLNTIPGLPVIYYGSEFGMTGASDPDNRRMMRFGDDLTEGEKATLETNKQIINLRKDHSALRYGDFYTLQADENIYAYMRSDMNERLLIILNKGIENQSVNRRIRIKIPISYDVTDLVSLKDETTLKVNSNEATINIDSWDWQVYKLQ
jgi:cyclomaltodextrinase